MMGPLACAGLHFSQQCSEMRGRDFALPSCGEGLLDFATTLFKVTINSVKLDFKRVEGGRREALDKSRTYTNLHCLVKEFTELERIEKLELFARIAAFFYSKHDSVFIDNPETYKTTYQKMIKKEEEGTIDLKLLPYGIFEVKEITQPRFIDVDTVVIYVTNTIPYKLTIKYPFSPNPEVSFSELPRGSLPKTQ